MLSTMSLRNGVELSKVVTQSQSPPLRHWILHIGLTGRDAGESTLSLMGGRSRELSIGGIGSTPKHSKRLVQGPVSGVRWSDV